MPPGLRGGRGRLSSTRGRGQAIVLSRSEARTKPAASYVSVSRRSLSLASAGALVTSSVQPAAPSQQLTMPLHMQSGHEHPELGFPAHRHIAGTPAENDASTDHLVGLSIAGGASVIPAASRRARFARCLHRGEQYRDHSREGRNARPQTPHSAGVGSETTGTSSAPVDPSFSGSPPMVPPPKTAPSIASSRSGYSRYRVPCADFRALSSIVRPAIRCRLR